MGVIIASAEAQTMRAKKSGGHEQGSAYEALCKKLNRHERGAPADAYAIVEAVQEMRSAERARARAKTRRKTGS
jgi:hypothetical protein